MHDDDLVVEWGRFVVLQTMGECVYYIGIRGFRESAYTIMVRPVCFTLPMEGSPVFVAFRGIKILFC